MSESSSEHNEFTFETESLALRGNQDYLKMLKVLTILESQRAKALQDIDVLVKLKKKALEDPLEFVRKLENSEDLGIPNRQVIADIPEIDWTKYEVELPAEAFRPLTRHLNNKLFEKDRDSPSENTVEDSIVKVRGRVYDASKPVTFNKLWTVEEQRRLDELLIKYPPEDNEMRRYTKIAKELGNRTPAQVNSRCQKYFKKLQLAGLPIPGRIPKSTRNESYKVQRVSSHNKRILSYKPARSTFFTAFYPPMVMSCENEASEKPVEVLIKTEVEDTTEDESMGIPEEFKDTEEYIKLQLLKRVLKEKSLTADKPPGEHHGFTCDECGSDPIIGTRWHCSDCDKIQASIDFCTDCLVNQMEKDTAHSLLHKFTAIRRTEVDNPVFDPDYNFQCLSNSGTGYNYLDPNFMPNT